MKPLFAALALAAASPAVAQQPAPQQSPVPSTARPSLIIMVSVDQLSADVFTQWRQHFTGGLKRMTEGVLFPSGYQQHSATETCPGHATLLTGGNPARTGIIANRWFDLEAAREDKVIYCAEDPTVPGSSSRDYTASAGHLKLPTLGERMKRANPASRNVSVAGKDRSALMMAGRGTDAIWWWGNGRFVSHAGASNRSADTVNADVARQIAAAQAPLPLSPRCAILARPVAIEGGTVGDGRFARAAGDAAGYRFSPALDGATLALSAALIDELKLGRGPAPDMLAIGLSATDYVGHGFGTGGAEMCIAIEQLDRALGEFFARLDASGIDYVVALSADHGGHDLPERARLQGAPDAERVSPDLSPAAVSQRLAAELGLPAAGLVNGDGAFGDMWVSRALPPAQRKRVVDAARRMLLAHRQVAAVFTREEILAQPVARTTPDSWTPLQVVRATYDPTRAGDFVVLLEPRVTPISVARAGGSVATHGSPWIYDRRVPIAFWRRGIAHYEQPLSISTVDIMPTLAALIGLPVPAEEIDGQCRDLDAGTGTTCPQ